MDETPDVNESDCKDCRLLKIACICQYRPNITSAVEFCLLTHATEYRKPTNTGRLIADCLATTHVYTWSRTEIDPELSQQLTNPHYQYWLVYPAEDSVHADRIKPFSMLVEPTGQAINKKHVFILLDATWQQAVKMVRKSPYLNHLPILSLSPACLSQYHLRRGGQAHHLCTAEVAAELLDLAGEKANALLLRDYFHVFSQHYLAARSGHGIKVESEQMRRLTKEYHHEIN
ncbi:tRNA-uridine aminocarboxypropyltransferase [Alkalimarinus alittae]|uniref:tRNA-uridine aminocarboxypropyltransferase n=1 Tax=Alkalimarinus alittae TaxID=2961619 RepID=A0ABY6N1I1_9ALTE|nr:DTW domain-containing protein [Alkalimarinus alittae]UZE95968.1 DTW domain-containing protein [Alkalimarinus alittae]